MSQPADAADHLVSRDRRQLRTRKALREGLLNLLLTRALDEISIRDIANASLVGYNTFFRHYESKADLIEDVAGDEISKLLDKTLPLIASNEIGKASLVLCEYVSEQRAVWSALLTGGAVGILREKFIQRALERSIRLESHEWLPLDLGAIFGVGATVDILTWWLKSPSRATPAEVAGILNRLVIYPTLFGGEPAPQQR